MKNPFTAKRCSRVNGSDVGKNASRCAVMYCATAAESCCTCSVVNCGDAMVSALYLSHRQAHFPLGATQPSLRSETLSHGCILMPVAARRVLFRRYTLIP